ncbi:MAG TPA: hypothetical protein VK427_00150 [Kofleriaceae bacterium]|nr:hypothetical protein [Kofleriaceae bacterium]
MTGGPWVMSAMIGARTESDALELVEHIEIAAARELVLVIHVVRGDWEGSIPLRVLGHSPTEERVARLDLDLALADAREAAGRVVVPLALEQLQQGVYWFDVVVGETNMTRVPLVVR